MISNPTFHYTFDIGDSSILGLKYANLEDHAFGAISWSMDCFADQEYVPIMATSLEWIFDHIERSIPDFSLFLFVWTTRLNYNKRINEYVIKQDGSLINLIAKTCAEYIETPLTEIERLFNLHSLFYECYFSDPVPIRWAYLHICNTREICLICALVMLACNTNSFIVAMHNEHPTAILNTNVIENAILSPRYSTEINHYNQVYEELADAIFVGTNRIMLHAGIMDDITLYVDGICPSILVPLFTN